MNPPRSVCIEECVVWLGPELKPTLCHSFRWEDGRVIEIQECGPAMRAEGLRCGMFPGLVNAHTHIGDGFLPEAAIPLTLEEAFFRPDGYKYRELTGTLVTRTSPCDIIKTVIHGNVLHEN